MVTLTGHVYHYGERVFMCPIFPGDGKCSWISPSSLSSTSCHPSLAMSSSNQSLSLATSSSVQTSSAVSSPPQSKSSLIISYPSNGHEGYNQFQIDQWALTEYDLTLFQLTYVFREIRRSNKFRRSIVRKVIPNGCRGKIRSIINNETDLDIFVKFKVNNCHSTPVDWYGNYLILALVSIKLKIEESLSILSTLGGAYSSLGEHYLYFAIKASETTLRQISLACMTGDPTIISRCSIYMVYSLCQRGLLKRARRLMINFIYPYITKMILKKTCDNIIRNMYKAAKFRIEYYYKN